MTRRMGTRGYDLFPALPTACYQATGEDVLGIFSSCMVQEDVSHEKFAITNVPGTGVSKPDPGLLHHLDEQRFCLRPLLLPDVDRG